MPFLVYFEILFFLYNLSQLLVLVDDFKGIEMSDKDSVKGFLKMTICSQKCFYVLEAI